jgi:imidazolonepropionase-like amidohydrolase
VRRIVVGLTVAAASASVVHTNGAEVRQGAGTGAVVITNATVIDGTGARPRRGVSVLLKGDRIEAVGSGMPVPVGARTIDGTGKFVVPGLIDTHAHIDFPMVFQLTPAERDAVIAHVPRAFLYNGVTTVLNLSAQVPWIWEQRAAQRAGRVLSPRIYAMGRSFTPVNGWGSRHGGALASPEDARAQARAYIAAGTDGFKIVIEDGLGASGKYAVMPDEMLKAIADEAHRAKVPMYVHAINLDEFRVAAQINPRAIVHGLEDPLPENDPLLNQLVDRRIYVVPTISLFESFNSFDGRLERFDDPVLKASLPYFLWERMRRADYMAVEKKRFSEVARMDAYRWAERAVPIFKANTLKMHRAGVKIAVGTDAGGTVGYNFQGYNTPREIEILVESGLTPMEALVAATRTGAEVIGVHDTLGTVEAGKLADLLILSANPLADIRNVRRIETVVQNGVVYPRDAFAYTAAQ